MEFFNGSTVLKTFTTAQPTYNYLWENVPQGSYNLTAKATDNLGASTTTSVVPVSVTASVAKIYDIHVDHLGTPRMVTDASGNSVWEWIGTPFGESLPNQNPGNTGVQNDFVMNLRFPGQVFDKETGLHYNYFRDYDPSTGRYVQSDPIGLGDGVNTYAYVGSDPVSYIDLPGLQRGRGTSNIVPYSYSSQVWVLTTQIRVHNPGFTYNTVRPASGPGSSYNQNDVNALSRIARDYQRNSQTNWNGVPVGRVIVDSSGRALIEPRGGATEPYPRNTNNPETHTLYPNSSTFQRNNPRGHKNNPKPHGHGHAPGSGYGRKGQGDSLDIFGNRVPSNSPAAHWYDPPCL